MNTYIYVYKTSDGVRHEARMSAASREDVFMSLREKGIKAIKVVAADGSKANGDVIVKGIRKRVLAASVIVAALVAGLAVFFVLRTSHLAPLTSHIAHRTSHSSSHLAPRIIAKPLPRQPIPGNRQRILDAADSLFPFAADRFLANFAEPGRTFSTDLALPSEEDFVAALKVQIEYAEDEFSECIDLKRIVVGIKFDLVEYLQKGGDVKTYAQELINRQRMEVSYRENAETKLAELVRAAKDSDRAAQKTAYDYWLNANANLQSMGIYPLPLPDQLRGYQMTIKL